MHTMSSDSSKNRSRSRRTRRSSVTSRVTMAAPATRPDSSLTGDTASTTSKSLPSFVLRRVSRWGMARPARISSRIFGMSSVSSGGTSMETCCPMTSSGA